jgi:hypothetical protein
MRGSPRRVELDVGSVTNPPASEVAADGCLGTVLDWVSVNVTCGAPASLQAVIEEEAHGRVGLDYAEPMEDVSDLLQVRQRAL